MTPFTLEDTRINLEHCNTLPEHVWVHSARSTVSPIDRTTLGVAGFHAPPCSAPAMKLTVDLDVDGITLRDSPSGFRLPEVRGVGPREARALLLQSRAWRLDRITRRGHAHYRHDRGWTSFAVQSDLVPLPDAPAFAMQITITNRGSEAIAVRVMPRLDPGVAGTVPLSRWEWSLPQPQASDVPLVLNMDRDLLRIQPGEQQAMIITVGFHAAPQSPDLYAAEQACRRRLDRALAGFPTIETNHDALNRYLQRCLITAMTCVWEVPGFAMSPHLATSGIDGRAVCTYLWDLSYAPMVTRLLFPTVLPDALAIFKRVDLSRHFAFTPDGAGTGPWYSANDTALTDIIWALACHDGPSAEWTTYLRDSLLASESRLPARGGLRDFGNNHNLLEMRTNGYEHVVPCLNALRARNLRRLADLCELTAIDDPAPLRRRANAIARAVRKELWNCDTGWFDCLHPDGSRHHVDSIQIFDVMTAGVTTRAQERRLIARLADGDFLAPFGVHSVSPRDERHFELVDVDWSGNGAFLGEPPALASTLYHRRHPAAAWRVLERLLWMGHCLPYLPQETFAHRPSPSPRGVANQCAALAGVHAILFAMLGISLQPAGRFTFQPQLPRNLEIRLTNLRLRNRLFSLAADHRRSHALLDGIPVTSAETIVL